MLTCNFFAVAIVLDKPLLLQSYYIHNSHQTQKQVYETNTVIKQNNNTRTILY